MRDRTNQVVLGTFVATFLYCLLVLRTIRRADESAFVPHLSVTVGVLMAVASLAVLIYFVHHVAMSIQADHIVAQVSTELFDGIDRLYPNEFGRGPPEPATPGAAATVPEGFDREASPVAADGRTEVLTGAGQGSMPRVRFSDPQTGRHWTSSPPSTRSSWAASRWADAAPRRGVPHRAGGQRPVANRRASRVTRTPTPAGGSIAADLAAKCLGASELGWQYFPSSWLSVYLREGTPHGRSSVGLLIFFTLPHESAKSKNRRRCDVSQTRASVV